MKKILENEVVDFILVIIKYVFGILSCSIGLFSEAMFNISVLLKSITTSYSKKHSKWQNVYNVVVGAVIIFIGFCILLNIFTSPINKVKWYMVIISIVSILIFNIKNSIMYTVNYDKDKETIIKSNRNYVDTMIISYAVIIGYVVTLFSKYLKILKYADALVGGLISIYIIFIGLKYLLNNFNGTKEDKLNIEKVKEVIKKYNFISCVNTIETFSYGSSKKIVIDISIPKDVDRVNSYPKLIDLCSEIFKCNKYVELIEIKKSRLLEKKRVVRSARNSRSRNSKKNTTKKNTKKKSKKS